MSNWENDAVSAETAYTVSADTDSTDSFQYHTTLKQNHQSVEKRKKKNVAAAACIAGVTLLVALSALFVLRYRITVDKENGSFALNIRKRSAIIESADTVHAIDQNQYENGPAENTEPFRWNGSKLHLEAPDGERTIGWSQVYRDCSNVVSSITVEYPDGSFAKGSGIVITEDGFMITSSHVVYSAVKMTVSVADEVYDAKLVGLDLASDLAVIKIAAESLQAAEFGSSETAAPGDVLSVLGSTVTGSVGIVTGTLSSVEADYKYRGFPMAVFQMIIPLGEQYSGAPVFDQYGRIIGIVNTEIAEQYSGSDSAEFAVPIEAAKPIIDELLEHGYVSGRPSTGLTVSEIPPSYVVFYKYPASIYVSGINENSSAYEAGIRKGDMIISANGIKLETVDQLYEIINGMKAGDTLSLELYREREVGVISFELMEAAQLAGGSVA